jgi:hypothetical protein
MKKYLNTMPIIFFILFLLSIFAHYNLQVSSKYETDFASITTDKDISDTLKTKIILQMKARESEIISSQKRVKYFIWIFGILFVSSIFFISNGKYLNWQK